MPVPALTAAAIRRYKPQGQRLEIPDAKAPGLYLIIQPRPTGAKSWAVRFRRPDGRPAKLTLGKVDLGETENSDEPALGGALTLRAARQLANKIDRERARGVDVVEETKAAKLRQRAEAKSVAENTFGGAVRHFFADHKTKWHVRPRRWREDATLLGLRWPPDADPATVEPNISKGGLADVWGNKPLVNIDGHDIHAVVDESRKHGIPGLAPRNDGISESRGRKIHVALNSFFAWARRQRRVTVNPCAGVWHPTAPPARDRVLSDAEIIKFWAAVNTVEQPFKAALQLLLLTGSRLNEVGGMRRDELGADGTWTIPGIRTKNHRPHVVPLSSQMREIIAAVPVIEGPFAFTTTGRSAVSGWSKIKQALDSKMGVPPWRLHDLRRTTATGMAELGIAPHVIEAVLNHVSGARAGVAGVYNRAIYSEEKRTALERWCAHVLGLVSGKPGKVVSIRKGGRS
jgi:integrase